MGRATPEQADEEDSHHGRGDEAPDELDVAEDTLEAPRQRRQQAAGDDEDPGRHPSDLHEALVAGLRLQVPAVDVHGEDRRGGVEHRVERRHHGTEECREENPPEARRQKVLDQHRIRLIGQADLGGEQLRRHDAGEDDDERDDQLDRRRQEDPQLALGQ